jgi:hypothetical protein
MISEMMTMKMTLTVDGRKFQANFVRSEDCGYAAGRLLLDLPCGEHVSVYRRGKIWLEAVITDGLCRRLMEHKTRRAALASAVERLAAETLFAESCC